MLVVGIVLVLLLLVSLASTLPSSNWCRVYEHCFIQLIGTDWRIHVSKLITGSDNGSSPGRRQAIIWTNVEYFSWTLRNKMQWNLIEIPTFSFTKMHLKISSGRSAILPRPQSVKHILIFKNIVIDKCIGISLWNYHVDYMLFEFGWVEISLKDETNIQTKIETNIFVFVLFCRIVLYIYFVSLSSSNRKYELLLIV